MLIEIKRKKYFLDWVLTAKYHDYPHNWLKLFKNSNYNGIIIGLLCK